VEENKVEDDTASSKPAADVDQLFNDSDTNSTPTDADQTVNSNGPGNAASTAEENVNKNRRNKSRQAPANALTHAVAKHDTKHAQEDNTQDNLTKHELARLSSLKAMLNASNARYAQASRNRRPKFAAGLEIKVLSGDHTGKVGVVLDADYIANRALISLSDQESPHWISFRSLGHAD